MNAITNLARRLPLRRRPRPTFTPAARALAETRQQPVLAQTGPIHVPSGRHATPATPAGRRPRSGLRKLQPTQAASTDPRSMARAAGGLNTLDWAALDAAKAREGLTYAQARWASANPLTRPTWPVDGRIRNGEAVRRRVENLAYPPCDVTAPDHAIAYIALMRKVDRITGTRGRNRWALPAIAPAAETEAAVPSLAEARRNATERDWQGTRFGVGLDAPDGAS